MGKKQKFQPEEIAAQVRILLPGKRGERIALEIMKRHGENNPLYKMALKNILSVSGMRGRNVDDLRLLLPFVDPSTVLERWNGN